MFSKVQALGTLLCCFWDNACEAAHFEGIYGGGKWLAHMWHREARERPRKRPG